ncbi:probable aspartyl protease At4g16563 [Cucumis sativus]|uniref:Pepsin A n=1 Tax=Cucumis sativus TaxID=3659 RepID=A0A0A0L5I7_CUCSA|nr:probable aspartyl protease At4g16563 [Cucumis sativus]
MAVSPVFIFLLCFLLSSPVFSSQIFLLPLSHSLSSSISDFNNTHNLLKSTATRSSARFHRHRHNHLSLPLSPGGDYTLSFNLGSESHKISLYMDTGSDLVWFPCSPFECILCEGKPKIQSPLPKIANNKSVSCSAAACSAAHGGSLSASHLCAISRCPLESIEISECSSFSCPPFYYAYGDGSLVARLYRDSLSLPTPAPSPPINVRNFTFGCAHTTLGEPVGVAGFGRGVLSMPSQLATFSPQLGNRFSYCLVSHSFAADRVRRPSPLILGRYYTGETEFIYTSLLENPKHPYFYSVGLAGISVGNIRIPAPEFLTKVDEGGSGGVVVDSGTTFTMLPAGLYESVVAEFENRTGKVANRARRIEENTGLSPCYYYENSVGVPRVVLHFVGEKSNVVLPRKNYFYEFLDGGDGVVGRKRKVGCLMLMNGGDEAELAGGPGATLGNYQQQGFEVVYDLEKNRVGFARRQCSTLWDNLNRSK